MRMLHKREVPLELFLSNGVKISLGERLAEGGQGKIFFVDGMIGKLAKIYHFDQDLSKKRERLDGLLSLETRGLAEVAAFPIEGIQDQEGNTVGFLMENLEGWVPLHQVYQIKSRLKLMSESDFGALVRISRNLSACVHRMHEAGIIVGDLNESNAFVSTNAMVKLVDADSVQIEVKGELYTCDVGRPEFIPPELQGHSLSNRMRKKEEDRFALAIMIFQTLTFGRHPFAGRPRGSEEISLELAISQNWYVYHTQGCSRLLPPAGLKLSFLSFEIREMFDRAFGGTPEQRPSSQEWFDALAKFESSLKTCSVSKWHRFWDIGDNCPWCEMEKNWRVPLFGSEFRFFNPKKRS